MKKLLALLLTVTMLCGTAITALAENKDYPQRFYDVPKDHWAFEYIAELVDRGVIAGYEDGSFKPSSTVTRAEFAKIMVCAASVPTTDNNVYFTDMVGHWAIPYVNAARNYLTAYSDNTYRPNQAAVREDVTMAMVKLKGYDVSNVDFSYLSGFTDTDSISNNVKAYVAVAVEKGLISGFEDNTFRGQGTLTRAEAATLLWKAFQYGNDDKIVDTPTDTSLSIVADNTAETQKSTATPKPTPTPKPTEKAIVSDDTPEPTEEPTPEPTQKPYKVDTLVKANVSNMKENSAYTYTLATSDNEGIIYYTDKKKIYSLTPDGTNIEVFNVDVLTIEEDFEEIKFTIENICCNTEGELYATVSTKELNTDILCKIKDGFVEPFEGYAPYPVFISDKNYISVSRAYDLYYLIGLFSLEDNKGIEVAEDIPICAAEYNNNIVAAGNNGIYEYNYNTTTKLADSYGTVGLSNNGYVIEKDGKFIIRSFDSETEIKFSLDDCAVRDKTTLNSSNISYKLFLMPDNSVVFYDTSAKAFRIISEND